VNTRRIYLKSSSAPISPKRVKKTASHSAGENADTDDPELLVGTDRFGNSAHCCEYLTCFGVAISDQRTLRCNHSVDKEIDLEA
jgi:hypothetical protein